MPAKKQPHPLRVVRDALSEAMGEKLSQPVFAKRLGVSASLVNAIESSRSREISQDLRDRLVLRFGVVMPKGKGKIACVAFPDLPLVEGLKKYRATLPSVERGAMFMFEAMVTVMLRSAFLAAFRNRKASIYLNVLMVRMRELADSLGINHSLGAAFDEILENKGFFPIDVIGGFDDLTAIAAAVIAGGNAERDDDYLWMRGSKYEDVWMIPDTPVKLACSGLAGPYYTEEIRKPFSDKMWQGVMDKYITHGGLFELGEETPDSPRPGRRGAKK